MRAIKDGIKGYYVRVGDFFGPLRPTPPEAIGAFESELAAHHPLNQTYIRCKDGTVLHLFQIPSHGWNYNVVPPTGYKGQGVGVMGTWTEAKQAAERHAEREFGGIA